MGICQIETIYSMTHVGETNCEPYSADAFFVVNEV